jgi:uncharacterized protein YbaR (Trm112 family)
MFIELTDHLRCPADHPEQFLVLMPSKMSGRQVEEGTLGCPVCNRSFPIELGVARFGSAEVAKRSDDADVGRTPALDAASLVALLGLASPGGYVVLVGAFGELAAALAEELPGVALVLVNAEIEAGDLSFSSAVRAPTIPLKTASMRGVALGPGFASDPAWVAAAARVVLPGNRVVGQGSDPAQRDLEIAASAGGCWVGVRARGGYPAAPSE